MIPIDFQVRRSKVKVKGHVGEGGALVFHKHLYFYIYFLMTFPSITFPRLCAVRGGQNGEHSTGLEIGPGVGR